jgi:hypothetical protein
MSTAALTIAKYSMTFCPVIGRFAFKNYDTYIPLKIAIEN